MKKYYLMHKDTPVAEVEIVINGLHLNRIINDDWMPFGSKAYPMHMDYGLTSWNDKRCVPFGRPNYKMMSEMVGIKHNAEWVARSHMCSLTDCYWYKEVNSPKKWRDVNFWENDFSSNLYKVLFYGNNTTRINNFQTPDLTTDGCLKKMWQQDDKGYYLIKDSLGSIPLESYFECFASRVFYKMDADAVLYGIKRVDNKDMCFSRCFIDSDKEEFVPMCDLLLEWDLSPNHGLIRLRELGFANEVDTMILGDYIVGNSDRHERNYGVIINSETRKIERFAPIFDSGACKLLENGESVFYHLGNRIDLMEDMDIDVLRKVENLDEQFVTSLIAQMNCWTEIDKSNAIDEVFRRVDFVKDLIRERNMDYERSDRI